MKQVLQFSYVNGGNTPWLTRRRVAVRNKSDNESEISLYSVKYYTNVHGYC